MKTIDIKWILLILTGLLLVIGVAACAAPAAPPPAQPTTAAAEPTAAVAAPTTATASSDTSKPGGELKVGLLASVKTLDPHKNPNQSEYWTAQLIYDYLVSLDKDLQIQPGLATEWTASDDGLTWTFKLRDDVKFHNGRPLTAADVKYSFDRIKNPDTASALANSFKQVESVEAPDEHTVVFKLSAPYAVLPTSLADPRAAIVAKEVVEANDGLATADGGSGPFMLKSVETDGSAILTKNPNYWVAGQPLLDSLRLTPIPDSTARVTALRTGDIDLASFITTNFISLLSQEKDVTVNEPPVSGQFYYLMMNNKVKPFDDPKVRQAIAYALDRDTLTQVSLNGEGYPLLAGPIPEWHWATAKPYYQGGSNIDKAKQLMAESSVPDGFTFDLAIWSSQDYVVRSAQLLQEQLAPLGIKINIVQNGDFTAYWTPVTKGDFQTTIQGTGGNVDPDTWLYETFHTGGGKNYMGYSNPEVDKLLEQGRAESEQAKRKTIYDQAQELIAADAPMAFLYNMKQTDAVRNTVKGFYHLPTMTLFALRQTWLDN